MSSLDKRKRLIREVLADSTITPIQIGGTLKAAKQLLLEAGLPDKATSKHLLISILDFEYQGWKLKPDNYRLHNPFHHYFAGLMGYPRNIRLTTWALDYKEAKS